MPRRGSWPSGRKTAHRGSRRSWAIASRPTRSQASIAPEKNRLLPTTMRRMPVLAQGTDSNSSLDYIQITATKLTFDPTTGTVSVIINAGGTGGGFTPFANSANSASFDSERAIDAFNNASQAYAAGDLGEYGRQMDLYYKYSGCSCGPVYLNNPQTAGPLSPTGPPGVQIPSIQIPPIQISPPAPISP